MGGTKAIFMTATPKTADGGALRSLIPARIDRLPWSRFHPHMVIALGVAWVLDGLEITVASNVGPDPTQHTTLNMSASEDVARPLSVVAKPAQTIFRAGGSSKLSCPICAP